MSEENDLIREFLVEGGESLDKLDRELLHLEAKAADAVLLNSIFRSIHTIKGTAGFFEFKSLERVAHAGENLLDSLRAGKISCNPDIASALLSLVDAIRKIFSSIESLGTEGNADLEPLCLRLHQLNEVSVPAPAEAEDELEKLLQANRQEMWEAQTMQEEKVPEVASPEAPSEPAAPAFYDPAAVSTAAAAAPVAPEASKTTSPASDDGKGSVAETSLRVDVVLLDQLMNLVGELVLSRNQILQHSRGQKDPAFLNSAQRLNLITSELQEGVMKTRMQPISNVWSKFPRVVRDLSKQLGKQIRLEMEGKETELDKTIIEAIKDPLTHIIRNSIDHGIEMPEVRAASGKNPEGTVLLRAYHEGGQVIMEITDDGAGLNTERIRQKAVEKGIYTADEIRGMSEQEIHRIIFMPGFSTAAAVTNVSGRGVGMDVVRSNIERIGGHVDLTSSPGKGSTLRVKIPLTLAIIPALVVSCGKEQFAIPQVVLVELVRVEGEQKKLVETIGNTKFYRLRGNLLPLVSLAEQLNIGSACAEQAEPEAFTFIVLRADEQTFGLIVDEVHDTQEIVVKPLGKQLKNVTVFAGATVMGDGRVALILDVLGLAKRADVLGDVAARAAATEATREHDEAETAPKTSFLVVQLAEGYRAALSLDCVHRLEEFEGSKVEFAGGRAVVQYRGGILPLIDLSQFFGNTQAIREEELRVVVHAQGNDLVGFVVNRIDDIIDEHMVLHPAQRRRGTLGSTILQKRVTDVLDPAEILASLSQ